MNIRHGLDNVSSQAFGGTSHIKHGLQSAYYVDRFDRLVHEARSYFSQLYSWERYVMNMNDFCTIARFNFLVFPDF